MRRFLCAAAPLALLTLAFACGDGDDKESATPDTETSPAAGGGEPTPVPDKPLPSPTPIPDDVPVIQVVAAGKLFAPMRSEFSALPKATIQAGGKGYEGVTLAALAAKAGAGETATVTIQGTRLDNLRFGAIRFALSEIGASTVFIIDESGHVLLASSTVPEEQWLRDITGIAFN